MDVGIDQAWQERHVAQVDDLRVGGWLDRSRFYSRNAAVVDDHHRLIDQLRAHSIEQPRGA
jgi:hypothetical protein